jgi:hypothetical protein
MLDLPPRLDAVYQTLASGMDTPWANIHTAIYGSPKAADPKLTQQYVSVYITRLNRRLAKHGQKIVPGELKRTYRLVKLR